MTGIITSIPPLVEQPPGNNSNNPAGLPGVTYTAAIPTLAQTWTGLQTYTLGSMQFAGSTSGNTFLNATAIASGVLTLPAATDTLVARNTPDTLTNKSIDGLQNTLTNIPAAAFGSTTGTGAVVLSNSPVITTPTGIVKGDVGLGNVANVDTTNAANISSGTLPAARLPNPSATTLGGVQSIAAVANNWISSISTAGVPSLSQPAFSNISGTVAATQLPNPSATTLGGVQSLAAVASKWINTISTSGVPSATQPAFTDISGSVAAAQMPALTGDITTTAGTVATAIGANKVTNAMRAQMAAYTLKGNATGATANEADIDVTALTLKAAPVSADIVLIQDSAAANAYKKATVGSLASAGSVASLNGQTGAVVAYFPPQGRLTLQTATPVMTTTQSAKTTIFYTPYQGNMVPIYDGTNMVPTAFAELSILTTDTTKNPAAIGASKVNDWFVWNDAGTLRLTHSVDWTNDTTRASSLTMVNGVLLNASAITNGPAASRGTYVGTTRSNASSQLDWIYGGLSAGGTAAFFGVWNAYNRVSVSTQVMDSTDTWNYTVSGVWRSANASNGMRVSFVTGLVEDAASFISNQQYIAAAGVNAAVGLGVNSTSAYSGTTAFSQQLSTSMALSATYSGALIGFNFVQAIEAIGNGAGTITGNGDAGLPGFMQTGLTAQLRM